GRRRRSERWSSRSSSRIASRSPARRRPTRSSTTGTPRRCRWCSTTPEVALVTAGDPARRTGGNLYNRHMLGALRRDGVRVTTVVLRDRRDAAARLGELGAPLVLVDTIAASFAAPHLARLRARGSEVVAVAHMRNGAMALARRADRVIAVSRALADELVAGGIGRRQIVVISPGRDRI